MANKGKPMKKRAKGGVARELNPIAIRDAMLRRVKRGTACSGKIVVPAVPGMLDHYTEMCAGIFKSVGREFNEKELDQLRTVISNEIKAAHQGSSRSHLVITYDASAAAMLNYWVAPAVRTVASAYEAWLETRKPPLFGTHPDARVTALAEEIADPASSPVLDIGADTGRNSVALARRGHPVDAVEMTPKFAEMLKADAEKENLHIRILQADVFQSTETLGRDYRLILLSEVVSDFHDTAQLRKLFEIAADVLAVGGVLVFNIFLSDKGYTPDKTARELAEHCYSTIFTRNELALAAADLPLELVDEQSVFQYEKEHLPAEAWPPTGWYVSWVLGLDMFDLEPERCPVDMRWVVYRKTGTAPASPQGWAT